jgi:DNA-binding CsgD family transcriptional regulator
VGANPIYGRIFVGRETELGQLQGAFDGARVGQGALAMVVGEPGMGKTALCEQVAAYVAAQRGRTLIGHCYEPATGASLPYLPFVEALHSYIRTREPEKLQTELGGDAAEIARLVPEVHERLQIDRRGPGSDPEQERWRLLQAVSEVLHRIALVGPLLLVLEDLHWADQGSLDLLLHVARNLAASRLLVVGTYRDVEVDSAHPLSTTLAELRRVREVPRLHLRGLSTEETQRMLSIVADRAVQPRLAETVQRQTEGNPLFIQEILRDLVEEGLLDHGDGCPGGESLSDLPVPAGVRDVIGKRFSRLSPDCVRLLTVAAVVGREFRLDTVQQVADVAEEPAVQGLEEATRIGVLDEYTRVGIVGYRFAHALFRQTLYEALSAPRRVRMHQEVASALERQYADRLEEHAAELAEHCGQSADREHLEKAVHYGELAAQRATTVYAYGEAARLLEQALAVLAVLDPNDHTRRCNLLLALGEAQMPRGDPRTVADTIALEAFALAEALQDPACASRACHLALEALHRSNNFAAGTPEFQQWAERADRYASPETIERAYADIALARVRIAHRQRAEGVALLKGALRLARGLDDVELLFTAAWQCIWNMLSPEHWQQAVVLAEEFASRSRDGVKSRTQGQILEFCGVALLHRAARDEAELVFRELSRAATQTRDASNQLQALSFEGVLALLDGRLDDAIALGSQLIERAQFLGMPSGAAVRGRGRALMYRGRSLEIRVPGRPALQALFLSYMGQLQEANELLASAWPTYQTQSGAVDTLAPSMDLAALLECAVLVGDKQIARLVAPVLADFPGVTATAAAICIPRLVADAFAMVDERHEAQRHYQRAIEMCTKMRFRPELALSRLGLAELLSDEAQAPPSSGEGQDHERREALDHLDGAIEELRAMEMVPALERALTLRDRLVPRVRRANPDGLTAREVEVLRLLATGRSSQQIAHDLVLSVRTVERHISNIYLKLDIRTRAQATAYALTHGLATAE